MEYVKIPNVFKREEFGKNRLIEGDFSSYDNLVKRLRNAAQWADKGLVITPSVCLEAADAIEELSAYVRQIEELRKDGYYLQKTKMITYGQAAMTQPLPETPKEET